MKGYGVTNFKKWMYWKYKESDTPEGDLAKDIWNDNRARYRVMPSFFPTKFHADAKTEDELLISLNEEKTKILEHLYENQACSECLEIFHECWKGYIKHQIREFKAKRYA